MSSLHWQALVASAAPSSPALLCATAAGGGLWWMMHGSNGDIFKYCPIFQILLSHSTSVPQQTQAAPFLGRLVSRYTCPALTSLTLKQVTACPSAQPTAQGRRAEGRQENRAAKSRRPFFSPLRLASLPGPERGHPGPSASSARPLRSPGPAASSPRRARQGLWFHLLPGRPLAAAGAISASAAG